MCGRFTLKTFIDSLLRFVSLWFFGVLLLLDEGFFWVEMALLFVDCKLPIRINNDSAAQNQIYLKTQQEPEPEAAAGIKPGN